MRPTARVPLLAIYGTADPIRPYETGIPDRIDRQPGESTPTLSTTDTVAAFVASGGDAAEPGELSETDPDPSDGTGLRTQRWADGSGTIAILKAVVGGGHTWPSARAPFAAGATAGPTSRDLDASTDAIAFVLDPDAAGR